MKGRAGGAVHQPDTGQFFLRKIKAGAPQGGEQGNILQGIVNDPQQVQQIHHVRQIEKLGVRVAVHWDALQLQGPGDVGGPAGGVAQQQGDVPKAQGAAAFPFPDGGEAHQFLDFLGHERRFVPVALGQFAGAVLFVFFLGGEQVDFNRRAKGLAPAGTQHGRLVVGDFRFLFPHGVAEHRIHGQQHVFVGTEILLEQNLSFRGVRVQGIILIFLQEQRGVCQTEAIDALLHVPHHEQKIGKSLVQRVQNGFLNAGHVLILVDEQGVEATGHLSAHLGILQGFQGQMLQVVIIQIILGLFQRIISFVHPFRQSAQGPQRGQGMAQILFRLGRVLGQQAPGGADPLFPVLPQGLEPGRRVRVFLGGGLFGAQPEKGGFPASQFAVFRLLKQLIRQRLIRLKGRGVPGRAVRLIQNPFHFGNQLRRAVQLGPAQCLQHRQPGGQSRALFLAVFLRPRPRIRLGHEEGV